MKNKLWIALSFLLTLGLIVFATVVISTKDRKEECTVGLIPRDEGGVFFEETILNCDNIYEKTSTEGNRRLGEAINDQIYRHA